MGKGRYCRNLDDLLETWAAGWHGDTLSLRIWENLAHGTWGRNLPGL